MKRFVLYFCLLIVSNANASVLEEKKETCKNGASENCYYVAASYYEREDFLQAAKWYAIAAEQGNAMAVEALKNLRIEA